MYRHGAVAENHEVPDGCIIFMGVKKKTVKRWPRFLFSGKRECESARVHKKVAAVQAQTRQCVVVCVTPTID